MTKTYEEKAPRRGIAPALTLMLLAPLLTEVLPGATRLSSLFVFPVEVFVWGGGALLIRYIVRRLELGWLHMLFLAIGLSLAEECLIQQTSLAPMVLQLKGIEYARAFGVNYVYLLWALVYEAVFVVFLPVYLTELIFPERRRGLWINRKGVITVLILFISGMLLAWYSWTQQARPQVFHVPLFNPPLPAVIIAIVLIGGLVFLAIGPYRRSFLGQMNPIRPPLPWVMAISGVLWAVLWYGLVLLAFGIDPSFPPVVAIAGGLILASLLIGLVPRFTADARWTARHRFATIAGIMVGSMIVSFTGFIGAAPADLYFKIIVDILAVILLVRLGFLLQKRLTTR